MFPTSSFQLLNIICLLILTFSFNFIPQFLFHEAHAAEVQVPEETQPVEIQAEEAQEMPVEEGSGDEGFASMESSTLYSMTPLDDSTSELNIPSSVSFNVDNLIGSANLNYPIAVPPGRSGLSPLLSLNYSSVRRNGWIGVGWDLSVGFIQRRGIRKGVPKYDDSPGTMTDVFEIHSGIGEPLELVRTSVVGNTWEYRLRIENDLLKVTYYITGNYWEVFDKSGLKMRFGSNDNTRINRTSPYGTGTYRWCIDRIEDTKTNYIEFIYQKLSGNPGQIYLKEIKYNGQVSGGLPHNHRIIFTLESANRPDPIYYYRGGFKMLTKKRLSSIEVRTNENLVRNINSSTQFLTPGLSSLRSPFSEVMEQRVFLPRNSIIKRIIWAFHPR